MLRVQLEAREDGEPLTLLIPVDDEMKLDVSVPEPWLFRGRWDGELLYGELRPEPSGIALPWSDGDRMTIDLEDVPVRVGRIFTVDGSDGRFHYLVRDVQRI